MAAAIREAFARAGLFRGTARTHVPLRLHFDGKWASALTKFMPTEIVHTDVLSAGHSTAAGSGFAVAKMARRPVSRIQSRSSSIPSYTLFS